MIVIIIELMLDSGAIPASLSIYPVNILLYKLILCFNFYMLII